MAGRGRGMTLPAWMTSGASTASTVPPHNSESDAKSLLQSSAGGQFLDAKSNGTPKPSEFLNAKIIQHPPLSQHHSSPSSSFAVQLAPNGFQSVANSYQPPSLIAPTLAPPPGSHVSLAPPNNIYGHSVGFQGGNFHAPPPPHFPRPFLPMHNQATGAPHGTPGGFIRGNGNAATAHQQPMITYGTPVLPPQLPPPTYVPPRIAPMMAHGNASQNGTFGAPTTAMDPNNVVTNWSSHETEDKRKYWFNKATGISTYEKPFCLKTPEERSLPPCSWKEFSTPDGRKYYNNGKESSWSIPEEYRIWKERIDLIEKKKTLNQNQAQPFTPSPPISSNNPTSISSNGSESENNNNINIAAIAQSQTQSRQQYPLNAAASSGKDIGDSDGDAGGFNTTTAGAGKSSTAIAATPVYKTREEAVEAFKSLLHEKKISTSMKFKEVMDACQHDDRFGVLKTAGEKKQALAEYQTKKLKLEKEAQRNKARKCRDAFLLMLAENTEIDARTRWRDALELLQEDHRFKNVDDPHDREELFNDFVMELEKKEREDRTKQREAALQKLTALLVKLTADGGLSRKSNWLDSKRDVLENLKGSEFRILEDVDIKRGFQDYIGKLETAYREEEKRRKEVLQTKVDKVSATFKLLLETQFFEGKISVNNRWKEVALLPSVASSEEYVELQGLMEKGLDGEEFPPTVVGVGSVPTSCSSLGVIGGPREVFDRVLDNIRDAYRSDKRLIRDVLEDLTFKMSHDSSEHEFRLLLFTAAGLKPQAEKEQWTSTFDPKQVSVAVQQLLTEEGEEIEDGCFEPGVSRSKILAAKQLRTMLLKRPASVGQVFEDMLEQARSEYEEELRRQRKREDRFSELLEEYFYRSDHVGTPWDDAKKLLERHSAYDLLSKSDRKRLFADYMDQLARKMEAKTKSMQSLLPTQSNADPDADTAPKVDSNSSRDRSNSQAIAGGVDKQETSGASSVAAVPSDDQQKGKDASILVGDSEASAAEKSKKRDRSEFDDAGVTVAVALDSGGVSKVNVSVAGDSHDNDDSENEASDNEDGGGDPKEKKKKHKKEKKHKKHKH